MLEFVKTLLQKNCLKRNASTVPTEFLPLRKAKSYVAVIDVEDTSFDACKTSIMNYFRSKDINGSVFFQDFRKIGSEDRLITSIQTTVTKKDLDWIGRPNKYKMNVLKEQDPDIFISLIKEPASLWSTWHAHPGRASRSAASRCLATFSTWWSRIPQAGIFPRWRVSWPSRSTSTRFNRQA
jgi:hypothetical protein